MATLTQKSDYPAVSIGILQPALQNRWRVMFETLGVRPPKYDYQILSMQAVRCDFDFIKKTLKLEIEQSVSGEEHDAIINLIAQEYFKVRVDLLDGNDGLYHSLVCLNARIVEHNLKFDYAMSGCLKHLITIDTRKVIVMEEGKLENINTLKDACASQS